MLGDTVLRYKNYYIVFNSTDNMIIIDFVELVDTDEDSFMLVILIIIRMLLKS